MFKRAAGRRAAEFVQDGTAIGLGTGSTVFFTLERLAERIRDEGLSIRGVPTSRDTDEKARRMGIPLVALEQVERLHLTIDGADEIDGRFDMIKGGGGALLREKIVASVTRREIIVVSPNKVVERLGVFPLPVEVVPFARVVAARRIEQLGATPRTRLAGEESAPYRTDNGNEILDCTFPGGIADPAALERALALIPGVVESGLFVGLAHTLVIGSEGGECEVREKS